MLILGPSTLDLADATLEAAFRFKAHARFLGEMLPALYQAAGELGVDPVVMAAQAGNETGWGHYRGTAARPALVTPDKHNTCGLKVRNDSREVPEAHAAFPDWLTGARAQAEHLLAYCTVLPPYGEFRYDPRWEWVYPRGHRCRHVEELGGRWAPNPDYGHLLVRLAVELGARDRPAAPPPAPTRARRTVTLRSSDP